MKKKFSNTLYSQCNIKFDYTLVALCRKHPYNVHEGIQKDQIAIASSCNYLQIGLFHLCDFCVYVPYMLNCIVEKVCLDADEKLKNFNDDFEFKLLD